MTGRGLLRGIGAGLGVVALCAATFWAGAHTAQVVAESTHAATTPVDAEIWTAKQETVGRTLRLPVDLRSVRRSGPLAQLTGVVTALPLRKGALVRPGDEVIEVSGKSVHAGRGTTPAYRALHVGDTGADVAQLRSFLCGQRVLGACRASTTFDAATAKAVKAWHARHGVKGDGIELGEIMWFPDLPVRLAVAPKTGVGTEVAATDRPLDIVSGRVGVQVKVTRDQAGLVPQGSAVTVDTLSGVTGEPAPAGDGTDAMLLPLHGRRGTGSLCDPVAACLRLLGTAAKVTLEATIEVVPSRQGIGVPTKAIHTSADGDTYVIGEDGEHVRVTPVQTAGGMVLVDGLAEGTRILLTSNG